VWWWAGALAGGDRGGWGKRAYRHWKLQRKAGGQGTLGPVYDDGAPRLEPTPRHDRPGHSSRGRSSRRGSLARVGGRDRGPVSRPFQAPARPERDRPNGPSLGRRFPLLPGQHQPPVPVTNLAQCGYALDTRPAPSLAAPRRTWASGRARGPARTGGRQGGALTPIKVSRTCSPALD